MEREFFVDIHTHPTLRAYNTPFENGHRNLWEKTYNQTFDTSISRWAHIQTKEIAKQSQANLLSYAEGRSRVIFDSLYPVEKGFLRFRKLPSMVVGRSKGDEVLRTVTGIDAHQLKALRKNGDYFQELLAQYAFLTKGQGKSPDGKYCYKLVASWDQLESVLANDPNCIAVVVTIEGAHAFNCGLPGKNGGRKAEKKELIRNIGTVKSWKFPPFFVNLAHHFYNELCGHTRSFKPVVFHAFNQKRGLNKGITDLGWPVIHELLATDNGRRILIDIKHMSVRARREYYRFVRSYNRLNPHDRIPIVCSHTGVNDFTSMKASRKTKDKPKKMKGSYFHNWSINLSDEEIRIIHGSGGLIGVMMDKGLLGSPGTLDKITSLEDRPAVRDEFIRMILENIFKVVEVAGDRSGWDTLAIGTDYDGLITHIDIYPDATRLPDLKADLVGYLKRTGYRKELWYGYEPEEMIGKVMQRNALQFMRKHL